MGTTGGPFDWYKGHCKVGGRVSLADQRAFSVESWILQPMPSRDPVRACGKYVARTLDLTKAGRGEDFLKASVFAHNNLRYPWDFVSHLEPAITFQ